MHDLVNVRLRVRQQALDGGNAEEEKTEAVLRQIGHHERRRDAFYALSAQFIRSCHRGNRALLPYGNLYDPDSKRMLIVDGADHIRAMDNESKAVDHAHRIIVTGGNFPMRSWSHAPCWR